MKEFVVYNQFHNPIRKAWTQTHTGAMVVEDGSVSPCPGERQFLFLYPATVSGHLAKRSAERNPQSLLGNPLIE